MTYRSEELKAALVKFTMLIAVIMVTRLALPLKPDRGLRK